MTQLSVNVNKIALLRNQRDIDIPSVVEAARTIITAGAAGITVHPRPDERHIRYSDVYELQEVVADVEFNIEGNPFTGKYMEIVREVKPAQATLVPDAPGANTSDHGWDVQENFEKLQPVIAELKELGIRSSLFMDCETKQIELAAKLGADRIELYTEPFARAFQMNKHLDMTNKSYGEAAQLATKLGMGVNAGHDLNLKNLKTFCENVPNVLEVSIGHALIAEAIWMGLEKTVKAYLDILENCK